MEVFVVSQAPEHGILAIFDTEKTARQYLEKCVEERNNDRPDNPARHYILNGNGYYQTVGSALYIEKEMVNVSKKLYLFIYNVYNSYDRFSCISSDKQIMSEQFTFTLAWNKSAYVKCLDIEYPEEGFIYLKCGWLCSHGGNDLRFTKAYHPKDIQTALDSLQRSKFSQDVLLKIKIDCKDDKPTYISHYEYKENPNAVWTEFKYY